MRSAGVSGRPRRRHTYDVVVEKIINSLAEGSLQPGDWLPPERALAQELQVSRATLREALKSRRPPPGLSSVPCRYIYSLKKRILLMYWR